MKLTKNEIRSILEQPSLTDEEVEQIEHDVEALVEILLETYLQRRKLKPEEVLSTH